jgi:hypothetical protein
MPNIARVGMKGETPGVEAQVERVRSPLPAGIWSEIEPEIHIEAVIYSAVGNVNTKKSSNGRKTLPSGGSTRGADHFIRPAGWGG